MKKNLSADDMKFILANWDQISGRAMAIKMNVSRDVIKRIYRENNIVISAELSMKFRIEGMRKITTSTPEMDRYLKDHYLTVPQKTMARHLKKTGTFVRTRLRQLGLVIPKAIIDERKTASRFQKGIIPFNKGKKISEYMTPEAIANSRVHRYKKGHKPHNTATKNGVVRTRTESNGRRSKWIRIAEGEWKQLHHKNWEAVHGKMPEDMCLWFKDNNPLNCDIDNLELITRQEVLFRNHHQYPKELKMSIQKLSKLKKLLKQKL